MLAGTGYSGMQLNPGAKTIEGDLINGWYTTSYAVMSVLALDTLPI